MIPRGTHVDENGYLRFDNSGKLFHRWVMKQHLHRSLKKTEIVHHKNGDKLDNTIDNLKIVTAKEHFIMHVVPILEARREAKITERLLPILEAEITQRISAELEAVNEDKAIKYYYYFLALSGAFLFVVGLLNRQALPIWFLGLYFFISGLVGWLIQISGFSGWFIHKFFKRKIT